MKIGDKPRMQNGGPGEKWNLGVGTFAFKKKTSGM